MRKKKRILSLVILTAMLVTSLPVSAQTNRGLCSHHTEHTEDCGYVPGMEESCNYVCEACNVEAGQNEEAEGKTEPPMQDGPTATNDSDAGIMPLEAECTDHRFDGEGFCETEGCGFYEPATDTDNDGAYEIGNAGQLFWFAALVNGDTTHAELDSHQVDAKAKLTANIDLNPGYTFDEQGYQPPDGTADAPRSWTPIGNTSNNYTGKFDGAGFTISGVYIDKPDQDDQGLFGYITGSNAEVANVGLENSYISGRNYVGGIAGYVWGNISNSHNSGAVSGSGYYIGGIAGGVSDGSISNSYNSGSVSGGGVGGIAGVVPSGSISNCYFQADQVSGGAGIGAGSGDVTAKTADEFASGEVTYLLNNKNTDTLVWRQNIDNDEEPDAYPVLDKTHGQVYYRRRNCIMRYTNYNQDIGTEDQHNYEEGFCTVCKFYEPATYKDEIYEIENAGQLFWFAALVNGDTTHAKFDDQDTSANAVLKKDINLNPGYTFNENGYQPSDETAGEPRSWTPIGNDMNNYTGKFDGAGFTISGVYINQPNQSYRGLFGYISGSSAEEEVVSNVGLENSYISGYIRVGGIAGKVTGGKISNSHNSGAVSGSGYYIGGIAGEVTGGSISDSYNSGAVSGSGEANSNNTGGIAGVVTGGSISNSYNSGAVSGNGNDKGGIAGKVTGGSISNTYYQAEQVSGGAGIGSGSGDATAKTVAEFASGEVAYRLNKGNTDAAAVWRQNIDGEEAADLYPVLDSGHKIVYRHYYDEDNPCIATYDNTPTEDGEPDAPVHDANYEDNGICDVCEEYQPATEGDNGLYEIGNAGQLFWFAALVNGDKTHAEFDSQKMDAKAKLTANIDLNPGYMFKEDGSYTTDDTAGEPRSWMPIGNYSISSSSTRNVYTGKFDGAGFTISGLYINQPNQNHQGLFGYISGSSAEVSNVGLKNSYISGKDYVGGIAGNVYIQSSISNSHNSGAVSGSDYIGGIAGNVLYGGSISNSYNSGAVSGSGNNIGGIAGNVLYGGSISNNYYQADQVSGGKGIGSGSGNATAKTADEFASGEVAYLLNRDNTTGDSTVWRQNIDNGEEADAYPVLDETHGKVYYQRIYCTVKYTNSDHDKGEEGQHNYEEGFCTECGLYQPATDTDGDGTYEIGNAGQLFWFAALVNGDTTHAEIGTQNKNANAFLKKDINLNPGYTFNENGYQPPDDTAGEPRSWIPIGNNSNKYTGKFNGEGFTISGVYINQPDQNNQGLFGYINGSDAEVANVGLENSYISGKMYVGGIAGYVSSGKISNSHNSGIVIGSGENVIVGGIAGVVNNGFIINSYNIGGVIGSGENVIVGGIAGAVFGVIINSYNIGSVSGSGSGEEVYVGKIAGGVSEGIISNTYYQADQVSGGKGIGFSSEYAEIETIAKTAAEFASGEVAHLLQGGQDDPDTMVWGQKLAGVAPDAYPVLSSDTDKKVLKITVRQKEGTEITELALYYINWGQKLLTYPSTSLGKAYLFYTSEEILEADRIDTGTKTYTDDATLYAVLIDAPSYTVTIPERAELSKANPTEMSISADGVSIAEEKSLKVLVDKSNTFILKDRTNEEATVAYTVQKKADAAAGDTAGTDISEDGMVLTVAGGIENNSGSVKLLLSPDRTTEKYSGTYTGTLIFTIRLEDSLPTG